MKYFLLILIYICSIPTFADTVVSGMPISQHTTFLKSKSPYVFNENIAVQPGVTLTVEKGTKLIFNQGSLYINKGKLIAKDISIESKGTNYNFLIQCNGCTLDIENIAVTGTPRSFVSAWDGSDLKLSGLDINYTARGNNIVGIQVFNDTSLVVSSSSFTMLTKALDIFSFSTSTITNSFFEYNNHAIYTFNSNVEIHENDFENNHIAIEFFASEDLFPIVDAHNNWWGQASPPPVYRDYISDVKPSDINAIVGVVIYQPWSIEPHRKKPEQGLLSNVLFIPGLMGSRLYKKEILENQLWEPNRNKDVTKLFLTPEGKSIENLIYTRDIISKTNIAAGAPILDQLIYKDFESYMNQLVRTKSINAWKAMPYDWRFSPESVLTEGISIGNGKTISISNIKAEVLALAKNSKTKKVTIITHSNGGLIAKRLMIELQKEKLDSRIDKVIFVAMPEYGTPQAITSLLYGHEQSIANGLILKADIAQKLGVNMPSAYTLLPTQAYFNSSHISIDNEVVIDVTRLHGLLGEKGNINTDILSKINAQRLQLDSWIAPSNIPLYQIVGTGLLTVSGLMKGTNDKPLPMYSSTGDGTVQDMYNTGSKTFNRSGKVFIVDLHGSTFTHTNIMNYGPVMEYIDLLIRKNPEEAQRIPVGNYPQYSNEFLLFTLSASTTQLSEKHIRVLDGSAKDSLVRGPTGQFDAVSHSDSGARFDLFDKNIQYVSEQNPEILEILKNTDELLDLTFYSKTEGALREIEFEDITLFKDSVLSYNFSNPEPYVEITMPLINRKIEVHPKSKTASSTDLVAMADKIFNAKSEIYNSNLTGYIKDRYMRRLDIILKSGDQKAFASLVLSIEEGIKGFDRFSNNPVLKLKYAKLRQDYIFILYLLK